MTVHSVVFSAVILRLRVQERKAVDGYNSRSFEVVIKTHIFDIREFPQSKDNRMKGD